MNNRRRRPSIPTYRRQGMVKGLDDADCTIITIGLVYWAFIYALYVLSIVSLGRTNGCGHGIDVYTACTMFVIVCCTTCFLLVQTVTVPLKIYEALTFGPHAFILISSPHYIAGLGLMIKTQRECSHNIPTVVIVYYWIVVCILFAVFLFFGFLVCVLIKSWSGRVEYIMRRPTASKIQVSSLSSALEILYRKGKQEDESIETALCQFVRCMDYGRPLHLVRSEMHPYEIVFLLYFCSIKYSDIIDEMIKVPKRKKKEKPIEEESREENENNREEMNNSMQVNRVPETDQIRRSRSLVLQPSISNNIQNDERIDDDDESSRQISIDGTCMICKELFKGKDLVYKHPECSNDHLSHSYCLSRYYSWSLCCPTAKCNKDMRQFLISELKKAASNLKKPSPKSSIIDNN